jgi:hypothetical protein
MKKVISISILIFVVSFSLVFAQTATQLQGQNTGSDNTSSTQYKETDLDLIQEGAGSTTQGDSTKAEETSGSTNTTDTYDAAGQVKSTTDSSTTDKDYTGEINIQSVSPSTTNKEELPEIDDEVTIILYPQPINPPSDETKSYPKPINPYPTDSSSEEDYFEKRTLSKTDLINNLYAQNAVYVKFDDVKGESDDSQGKSKPKEIIVVGSKVRAVISPGEQPAKVEIRGWDPEDKSEIIGGSETVKNEEDLQLFAATAVTRDINIQEIKISEDEIHVDYATQAKLLWFIPVSMRERATVRFGDGEHGRIPSEVKVKFPWWHIFAKKAVKANNLTKSIEEELAKTGEDAQLANIDLQNTFQKQAQVMQTLSNIMKTAHDTAMGIIRNLK